MRFKKSIRTLSCMLLLGLGSGSPQLNANPQSESSQPKISYNFDNFFNQQFEFFSQQSESDLKTLIENTYSGYHSLIEDAKEKNPGQTFTLQDLLDRSDQVKLFRLALKYMSNFDRFGYGVGGFPKVEKDLFKLSLIDKKRKDNLSRIELEINMRSSLDSIDATPIVYFLKDSTSYLFVCDSEGKYLWKGFKSPRT
jgi:hypothetical protein